MNSRYFQLIAVALLAAATAAAQNPDSSGNGNVTGDYFVREVLMNGNTDGTVTTAVSVLGVATFDGKGNYTFKGQSQSLTAGANNTLSLSGTYNVGSNGFLKITSLADPTDSDFGGVSAVGPWAFVASATEGTNVSLLIGIPAGASVSAGSFKGNYTAGAIDFPSANINSVREATFTLSPDGAGNLGTVTLSGAAADQGGTALSQSATGVTYTLSGEGSGTINFGGPGTQIVNGSKTLYISKDGNVVLGGSATGYDMLVGIPALSGNASNSTANTEYYMGGFESTLGTQSFPTAIDAYYGSVNANGSGTSLFHNRIQSLIEPVYDYTFDSNYSIAGNGTVPIGDIPYNYTYGVPGSNGVAKAFIATGDATGAGFYSLTVGFAQQTFSGSGVYLAPNGVVSSATFSPITNPIAPNEFIALFGSGLAASAVSASSLPLPNNLGNVTVTINGTPVPLNYVSPTEIVALVPSAISPNNSTNPVYYATIQVNNNSAMSNPVTVFTNNTAPGVFANPVADGAAAAEHANYALINSSNPANIGETVIVYGGGFGAVTPTVPDGSAAPSSPLSTVTDPNISIDFSDPANPLSPAFAGLTPTATGLYQIDVAIPSNTVSTPYVDVGTTEGYTSQATLSVAGGSSAAVKANVLKKRMAARSRARAKKSSVRPLAR